MYNGANNVIGVRNKVCRTESRHCGSVIGQAAYNQRSKSLFLCLHAYIYIYHDFFNYFNTFVLSLMPLKQFLNQTEILQTGSLWMAKLRCGSRGDTPWQMTIYTPVVIIFRKNALGANVHILTCIWLDAFSCIPSLLEFKWNFFNLTLFVSTLHCRDPITVPLIVMSCVNAIIWDVTFFYVRGHK